MKVCLPDATGNAGQDPEFSAGNRNEWTREREGKFQQMAQMGGSGAEEMGRVEVWTPRRVQKQIIIKSKFRTAEFAEDAEVFPVSLRSQRSPR